MTPDNESPQGAMRDLLLGFDRLVDLNQHERINEIFGVFPVDRLIRILVDLLDDLDPFVRRTACEVLIHIDYGGSREKIAQLLEDEDENVRYDVPHWLLQKPDFIYFDYLVRAIRNNPDPDVRSNAAMALGKIGDDRALDDLLFVAENDQALDFQGDPVSRAAKIAVEAIRGSKK